ncbi:MAG: DUF4340 domain-containing protein [Ruminococcus sp.]|nr:DUF4340 domain-containing protein [Ruminococcus sp.]
MKKHIIAFLILLIAAGVSVGVFLKVRDKKEKETKQKEVEIADLSLFSFDSSVIDKIEIKNPEGSYTAQLQDKKWVLTDGGDFVLDQDYMILMCTYFSTLTASDTHTGSPESYGLDEANASTITLSGGGQSYTINIGNVSPTKEYYYVTVEGKSKIYSVASVYDGGNNFSTEKMILKSKHLVEYGDNDISQITIIRDGKIVCDLTYDEESAKWSLPEEYSLFELDVTAVTSMINVMTRLEAEQMLDEDLTDMSKYGFDDPYAEVIVKGKDGTERHIIAGDFSGDLNYAYLLVYNGDEKDKNQTELYFRYDVDFIDSNPIDFINTTVYNPSLYDIVALNVEYNDQKYEFTLDQEQKKCTYKGQSIQLGIANILTAFTNYYNSFSIYVIEEINTDISPELKDPLFTAEYIYDDGEKIVYQLVDAGNEQCYVFVNGEYTGEIISDSCLIGNNSVDNYFDILKSAADIDE